MDLEFVRVFAHSPWAFVVVPAAVSLPAVIWFVDTLRWRRQMRMEDEALELWLSGAIAPRSPQQIAAGRVSSRPAMPSATPRLVMSALAIVALVGLGVGAVAFIRPFIGPPLP